MHCGSSQAIKNVKLWEKSSGTEHGNEMKHEMESFLSKDASQTENAVK